MTPAETVISELGVRPLARALNRHPTTILRWRSRGNGRVPSNYHERILELADGKLSADDLVFGRKSDA